MKNNKLIKAIVVALVIIVLIFALSSCVDQSNGKNTEDKRVVATSNSIIEICDRLDIKLVGITKSDLVKTPKGYKDVPKVGTPMAPDIEKIKSLRANYILSPVSLMADLKPKYDALGSEYAFVNLNNVFGMYKSIEELGVLFNKEEKANTLVSDFNKYYKEYQNKHKNKKKVKVLILMGLPGSYVVATDDSYVGSLVKMAGAENVFGDVKGKDFVNINTEDMIKKDPDIILRTCHAMPKDVLKMFNKEFKENDIWSHFEAVKNNRVYDLNSKYFGMSTNFQYKKALDDLDKYLYGEE